MKLNKLIYSLSAAALLFGMSSCKDFLDTMPDTRVELNSVEKARMLLANAYPRYNPGWVCELTSDNMEDNNTADAKGTRYNLPSYARFDDEIFAFEDVKSSSDEDSPSGIWEGYYNSIAHANAAIECLEKLQARVNAGEEVEDANILNAVLAEALLIRAYGHFMLANVFCEPWRGAELSKNYQGIPYSKKPETTVMPNYERGTLDQVYANIEADIQRALPMIDNSIYDVPKYHFNLQAAYAFAARFYLWKREYRKVLDYCNRAFGGEGVDASQYMSDLWSHLEDMYYLSDFGLYYNSITQPRNFLLTATYSIQARHYSGGRRYAVTRDAKRATVEGPGPSWERFQWTNSSEPDVVFAMHPAMNGCGFINGKSQYGVYFGGNLSEQFEYTNKIAGIGYAHITRAEITGEETLLMRAEAKLFLGDKQGAIDDLIIWENARRDCPGAIGNENKWVDLTLDVINKFYVDTDPGFGIAKPIHLDEVCPSQWYTLTPDKMGILQCIQHFRRIEMIHTGMRFFDLKRYGIEWSHKIGTENRIETMSLYDRRRAIQIPSEVLSAGFEPSLRGEPANLGGESLETYIRQ